MSLADEPKATSVVEDRVGAGGQIAHQALLAAPPDGYTVMLASAAITILPALHRKLPYVPVRDFVPVARSVRRRWRRARTPMPFTPVPR